MLNEWSDRSRSRELAPILETFGVRTECPAPKEEPRLGRVAMTMFASFKRRGSLTNSRQMIEEAIDWLERAQELAERSRSVLNSAADAMRKEFEPGDALRSAQAAVALLRKRDKIFGDRNVTAVMGDPVWEMLLDLFIAKRTGKKVSVSSLCVASNAPAATALRYITLMVEKTAFVRTSDPKDGRRAWIALSDWADEAMFFILE